MRLDYLRLSAGGALAKLAGAAREILLARYFGTGPVADAYRGSLTLTLAPVHLLTAKAIETCFVPLYARYEATEPRKAQVLLQSLLLFFVGVGALTAGALAAGAGPLVRAVLHGFDPARAALAVQMVRILAAGVPAYVYCGVLSSLGMARRDFAIPALRPALQNLGMVVMIVAAAWRGEPALAAYGFSGTYVLLAGWATLHLRRRGHLHLQASWDAALVRETGARMWNLLRPLLLLSALVEGNILVERHIAAGIGPGNVAALDYARFLTESVHFLVAVPLGLLGLSLFANLSDRETDARLDRLIALLMVGLVPLSAFLAINGREVLAVLYLRGQYDLDSLHLTTRACLGLSLGLWAFSASHVLQRVMNARLRNRTVLCAETVAIVLNVGCNLLLWRPLGVLALGMGVTLGALGSLFCYLKSVGPLAGLFRRTAGHMLVAVPPYLLIAWFLGRLTSRSLAGVAWQGLAAAAYWGVVIAMRRETRRMVWQRIGGRRGG